MENNLGVGVKVIVKCPVYKNGKKFKGTIKEIIKSENQAKVIIEGNKKSTIFSIAWITLAR